MAYTEQEKQNLKLISALYESVLMPMDSSQVDRFIVPSYIQHSPLAESGSKPLKEFLDFIKQQSPDAEHRVKRMFADGDHVITHTHVIRHPGDPGMAVVDIFRIDGEKVVEHWDVIQEIDPTISNADGMF